MALFWHFRGVCDFQLSYGLSACLCPIGHEAILAACLSFIVRSLVSKQVVFSIDNAIILSRHLDWFMKLISSALWFSLVEYVWLSESLHPAACSEYRHELNPGYAASKLIPELHESPHSIFRPLDSFNDPAIESPPALLACLQAFFLTGGEIAMQICLDMLELYGVE